MSKKAKSYLLTIFLFLGIVLHADTYPPKLLGLLKTQIAISSRFISRAKTLKAKKKIIETFILPKFLYYARHSDSNMKSLGIMQNLISSVLKAGKKMEIRIYVLSQSSARAGISLPHFISKTVSAKISDEIVSSDENPITFSKDLSLLINSLIL